MQRCSDSGTTTDYVTLYHSAGSTTREETRYLLIFIFTLERRYYYGFHYMMKSQEIRY